MIVLTQIVFMLAFIMFVGGTVAEEKKESQYLLGLLAVITMLVLYKSHTL